MKKLLLILAWAACLGLCLAAEAQLKGKGLDVRHLAESHKVIIDVSKYQGNIDWNLVARTNVKGAYIRATVGKSYIDPTFHRNLEQAGMQGIKCGAYHVLSEKSPVSVQAEKFLEVLQGQTLQLLPALDVEKCVFWTSAHQLADSCRVFMDLVEQALGYKVILYSGLSFFENYLAKDFSDRPLWLARYTLDLNMAPNVAGNVYLWQCSQDGYLPGIDGPVDVSVLIEGHKMKDIKIPSKKK